MRSCLPFLLLAACLGPLGAQRSDQAPTRTVPVYGGTTASWGDQLIVAADPLRDAVSFVKGGASATATLDPGSEPFRVVTTADRAYVTLRGTGQLVAFDHWGTELRRRDVCAHPRGVAAGDAVFVACAGGELVELDPTDLSVRGRTWLAPDLRDVVVDDDVVLVSRFRAAEVLRVDAATHVVLDRHTPSMVHTRADDASARVAWRMVPHPEGGALMVHQAHTHRAIDLEREPESPARFGQAPEGPYGKVFTCDDGMDDPENGPLVTNHLTRVEADGTTTTGGALFGVITPVDIVIEPAQGWYGIAGELALRAGRTGVALYERTATEGLRCVPPTRIPVTGDRVTSVTWEPEHGLAVYDRHHGRLVTGNATFDVPAEAAVVVPRSEEALFHQNPGAGMSCASCHPEGQDDGHTWQFARIGARRTQNLAGGLSARGAFHWTAEFDGLDALMADVFSNRMAGRNVRVEEVERLATWLDGIPAVPAVSPAPDAVLERGRTLFEDAQVGCTECHAGPQLADHELVAVATGATPTKTPSLLGVGTRAPYMHTGCADTLLERLTDESCGGDNHGDLSGLAPTDLEALAAYVSTL